ncbi:MAG: metallophosphoesterase [Bacteroidales bacterium]
MKIGILHISDLHIENENYEDRIPALIRAIDYDINQLSNLYIVITGDISKYGRKSDFLKAKEFIDSLKDKLKPKGRIMSVDIVLVPGNHDCCFDEEKKTRKSILNDCRMDIIEEDDYFDDAMAIQNNFWDFNEEITNNKIRNKVSYKKEFIPHINFKVSFHCYNTSWITEIEEKQGNLVIPENKFINNENGEYVISIFHHPLDWLSSSTKNNNKQRFEEHLINSSNLVIYGHEHDNGKAKNIIQQNNKVVFCGGKAFEKEPITDTGFSYYEIDLADKSIETKTFIYDREKYTVDFNEKFDIVEKNKREFLIINEFEKKITQLNIPLKHSKKPNLLLADIFVYPDLEPLLDDNSSAQYPNSSELVDLVRNNEKANIFIEGADQSGKTSLLFTLYKRFYEMGFTPIYLRGKNCNETNIKNLVKKSLKEQYNSEKIDLFFQQDHKVILLDNFHKSELNSKFKKNLIENLAISFDYIFITSDNSYGTNNVTEEATNLKEYVKYKLLPLGHEKRGELIEQWLQIGENSMTIKEEILLSNVQSRFNEINSLIGNKLMPSYPIFILTLLQGLDDNLQDYSQASYANIYLVLIKSGLIKNGIKDVLLTSFLNILKELAFYLFENKLTQFSVSDFDTFLQTYKTRFFKHQNLTIDKILETLASASILKFDDGYYSFSYKYIYFYLVAQKISTDINKYEGLIYSLCDNIHVEENANILIFLSHHSKAQILIDNIVFTSEIPFDKANPITLDKDDEFVKFISDFTQKLKDDIIEERNPKEEVKKELKKRDRIERQKKESDSDSDDSLLPSEAIEMNQALRTVKIIGQIVKNQSGDFEKEKLIKLVEAAYNTIFRFLGFFSELLIKDKDQLIEAVIEEIKEKESKNRNRKIDVEFIEKTVRRILQFIAWRICVESITSLMFSVGTKGQNELFDIVDSNINTTASKIVSFAIKTYYDKIDVRELEQLFVETKDNYLAQCILREYIKKHLYTNFVERTKRERIIQIAGFKPQALIHKIKRQ